MLLSTNAASPSIIHSTNTNTMLCPGRADLAAREKEREERVRRLKEQQEEDRRRKLEELKQHVSRYCRYAADMMLLDIHITRPTWCRRCKLRSSESSRRWSEDDI